MTVELLPAERVEQVMEDSISSKRSRRTYGRESCFAVTVTSPGGPMAASVRSCQSHQPFLGAGRSSYRRRTTARSHELVATAPPTEEHLSLQVWTWTGAHLRELSQPRPTLKGGREQEHPSTPALFSDTGRGFRAARGQSSIRFYYGEKSWPRKDRFTLKVLPYPKIIACSR